MIGLSCALMHGEGGQQLLIIEVKALALGPGAEHAHDALLPVDQGAIAVEAQRVEISESHGDSDVASPAAYCLHHVS